MRHLETSFPPSFDSHASGCSASAKIDYIRKAKVRRPGRFQQNMSVQQELLLRLGGLRRGVGSSRERDVLSGINSGVPQDIAIPNVTPSFTTYIVGHEHSLQVTGGFSPENHPL